MTATLERTSTPSGKPKRAPFTRNQKIARGAILIAIAFIAVMWVYAFGFASDTAVAKLQDTAWTKRAEQICKQRNDLIDLNAKSYRDAGDFTPQALGRSVAKATDLVEAAQSEILSVSPPTALDQKLVGKWADLYRTYIADRRATEVKLAKGEKSELNETELYGSPISDSIADFTNPNNMTDCAVPSGN
ncbi:MAG: hypothetical protein JWM34_649 [Ilumatobacteraceae bacterium]|nr:hypothetical protein [Ilumatobacteraceae bacterium]